MVFAERRCALTSPLMLITFSSLRYSSFPSNVVRWVSKRMILISSGLKCFTKATIKKRVVREGMGILQHAFCVGTNIEDLDDITEVFPKITPTVILKFSSSLYRMEKRRAWKRNDAKKIAFAESFNIVKTLSTAEGYNCFASSGSILTTQVVRGDAIIALNRSRSYKRI